MWARFQGDGYVECPISKHIYKQEDLDDMKPQKLLNYILQNLETATNVRILWEIFKLLKGCKTKLILYTYDSFLFDLDKKDKQTIIQIQEIFKKHKLQTKFNYGTTYDFK